MNDSLFDIRELNIVITGGGGALCGEMARAVAKRGARVAILDIRPEAGEAVAAEIRSCGGDAAAIECDVTDAESVRQAHDAVMEKWGRVDVLINGAGGNHPKASTNASTELFDLLPEDIRAVFDLNFIGTFIPSLAFGKEMARQQQGIIINIASMNSVRPLTRIPAYSAAKAAVANYTQWLAVHMAQNYSPRIRVNAIAPGFFITLQSRYLLFDQETGGYTERGQKVVAHTPMNRMGSPEDLTGTLIYLISPASAYVTGVMVPVDGGFSAYSGV